MKTKIGIVGGSGFVGYSLAKHFAKKYCVKILDVKKPTDIQENISFEQCDVRNFESIKNALKDVDALIHTAIIQIPLINENKQLAYDVNFKGTANICKAVEESEKTKAMILSGTWHTIGERELSGRINEEFGFRPDKVEERARLYALSKMAQESIVRFYSEMSEKVYGIIRMGTVLGKNMPEKTAANIFIRKGLQGEPITPYKTSMYRPMLYVDIEDICMSYEILITKFLENNFEKDDNSLSHIVNVYYPNPLTILELAKIIQRVIIEKTNGVVHPPINIVDQGKQMLFNPDDIKRLEVDISKAKNILEINNFISPRQSVEKIVNMHLD